MIHSIKKKVEKMGFFFVLRHSRHRPLSDFGERRCNLPLKQFGEGRSNRALRDFGERR